MHTAVSLSEEFPFLAFWLACLLILSSTYGVLLEQFDNNVLILSVILWDQIGHIASKGMVDAASTFAGCLKYCFALLGYYYQKSIVCTSYLPTLKHKVRLQLLIDYLVPIVVVATSPCMIDIIPAIWFKVGR